MPAAQNRLKRAGYLSEDFKKFSEMLEKADEGFFMAVNFNPYHVMCQRLPPLKNTPNTMSDQGHIILSYLL